MPSAIGGHRPKDSAWPRSDQLRLRTPAGRRIEIFERLDPHNRSRRVWYVGRLYPEARAKVDERQLVVPIVVRRVE